MTTGRNLRIGEAALGVGVVALGLFIAVQIATLPTAASQAAVGPKVFPYIVAGGLMVVGGFLLREALVGEVAHGEGLALDWPAVALVSAGIILMIVAIERAGWVISAALMFAIIAHGFGSRRPLLDLGIGLVLSALTFFLFSYLLGLDLPGGFVVELLWPEDAD